MNVDLEKLQQAIDFLYAINHASLNQIVWERQGTKIVATDEQLKEWKYVGLNNVDFARTHGMINEKY